MTADSGSAIYIIHIREMSGNEGENFDRDAIDGDERVPPLADSFQRSRSIPVELRSMVEGEPVFRRGN